MEYKKGTKLRGLVIEVHKNENYSIIEDENSHKHYYPTILKKGTSIPFIIERKRNNHNKESYFLDLSPAYSEYYELNEVFEFEVTGYQIKLIGDKEKIILNTLDYFGKKQTVLAHDWQINNKKKPAYPKRIEAIISSIEATSLHLHQYWNDDSHPFFNKGVEYPFEVIDIDEGNERIAINTKGIDGNNYIVRGHFKQIDTLKSGDLIKCTFLGVSETGWPIVKQTNDGFVTYKDIFDDGDQESIFNLIDEYSNSEKKQKLVKDYKNRENIWVFSFEKCLNEITDQLLNSGNLNKALELIEKIIRLEKWIINSNFLKTFNQENREKNVIVAKSVLLEQETRKKVIINILTNKAAHRASYIINNKDFVLDFEYAIELKLLFSLTSSKTLPNNFIFQAIEKLSEHKSLENKHVSTIYSSLFNRLKDAKKALFNKDLSNRSYSEINNSDNLSNVRLLGVYWILSYKTSSEETYFDALGDFLRGLALVQEDSTESKYLKILASFMYQRREHIFETPSLRDSKRNLDYFSNQFISLFKDKFRKTINKPEKREAISNCKIHGIFNQFIVYKRDYYTFIVPRVFNGSFIFEEDMSMKHDLIPLIIFDDLNLAIATNHKGISEKIPEDENEIWNIFSDPSLKEKFTEFQNQLSSNISTGKVVIGTIKNVNPDIGIFIDLGLKDGLIINQNISYKREKNYENFKENTLIKTTIDKIDKGKIYLSRLDLIEDPWEYHNENIIASKKYKGRIVEINEHGLFVDLAPRVTGLVPYEYSLSTHDIGDDIFVEVYRYDINQKKISLSEVVLEPNSEEFYDLFKMDNRDRSLDRVELNSSVNLSFNSFKTAYLLNDLASYEKKLELKIMLLKLSRFLFTLENSSVSYLNSIYIFYFEAIKELKDSDGNDLDKEGLKEAIAKIESEEMTLERFPEINKVLTTLNLLTHYSNDDRDSTQQLFEHIYSNRLNKVNRTLAKLLLSYNHLIGVAPDDSVNRLYKKNILKYLISGVVELRSIDDEEVVDKAVVDPIVQETVDLIDEGEGKNIEFKSSLYTHVLDEKDKKRIELLENKLKKSDKPKEKKGLQNQLNQIKNPNNQSDIVLSTMKNIAAFANTDGGTILIGVDDNKNIIGLNNDFKSLKKDDKKDEYKNKFDNYLESYIGNEIHGSLKVDFVDIEDKTVFKIDISKSNSEIFLKDGTDNEGHYYIRANSSARKLSVREYISLIKAKS